MSTGLFSNLLNEKTPVKDLFQDWRKLYRENHLDGTRFILQLCVDLTGYSYVVKPEDIEQSYNLSEFVQEKVVKSNFQEVYALAKTAVLERLFKLLEQMIVGDSEELLLNNFWLNQMIRLMVAFCEADEDECNMVGGCLSTFLLVHISAVRQGVMKKLEKARCGNDDAEEIERQERNLEKSSKLLVRNIETVHRFTNTLPTIADLYCRMLVAYPGFYVENGVGMKVLLKLLQCRHGRTFALILNCFKNLLNREVQSKKVVDAVTRFFLKSAQEFFVQGMLNFKQYEKHALEVVLLIQNQFQGQAVFDPDVIDKLRQFMFNADDQVRGYAVDFHVSTLCRPEDDQAKDGDILLHILKLYVAYEHSLESLFSLIGYLWQLDFFETWDVLSDLLTTEAARKDNFFLVHTIVLVFNHCHEILMQSIGSEEQQQPVDRDNLRRLVKSFMRKYPASLRSCIPYERAYSELLKPASVEHHRTMMQLKIDIEPYYEALFDVLETVARTGTDFGMLNANLRVIRSYASVIIDTEQIWSELMAKYVGAFIETRQKITSANVGKDSVVNETYYHSIVRVTAILELDHDIGHSNLSSLMKMAVNDFNLLGMFKFNQLQNAMFYRFYKSAFYSLLHAYQVPSHDSGIYADLPRFCVQRLKRRVLELLRILIKHLGQYDEPLEICLHQFTTLVDMLLMTQPDIAELDISELANCEYRVEPALLERMAKYLLNYLISKEYATHELAVQTQKQLLEKYIHLYQNHRSLPRITDTYHIVANFCFPTAFEEQLKRLMLVLYRADPADFYEVISQAAFQLLLFYKSEPSVKNFFKKFLAFACSGGVGALVEDEEEGARVISRVVEKILNYLMGVVIVNPDEVMGAKKMLKLIEPMLPVIPGEELVKLEHLLVRRQEYETLERAERKVIDKFVKVLRKCADA